MDCLVGARHQVLGVFDRVPGAVHIHRNDGHGGADRDHRETRLDCHAFGGAVAGSGFVGVDGCIRHELYRRHEQAGGVSVTDDRAIHLGELTQAGGRKFGVDGEPTGGEPRDGAV